jgi:predicted DNA-binding mobile mystery protein A
MARKSLQLQQMNDKMQPFALSAKVPLPPVGWIKAIRLAIGMSMLQLGKRLGISKQGVLDMERREKEGSITIKTLREVARALDMQLVYGFVPLEGSLDALIEKRARELAAQIVQRTAHTMQLEDQANSEQRIEAAIRERAADIQREMPRILWD